MRTRPASLDARDIAARIEAEWGLRAVRLRHMPVGGGSHHWVAVDARGSRQFVTVDDLARKPWFGAGHARALAGLEDAYRTARVLRDGGLNFVVAPIPAGSGRLLVRLGERHTVALFPFVDGRRLGRFDVPAGHRRAAVDLIARLHLATQEVEAFVPRWRIGVRFAGIASAIAASDRPWTGGPYSERVRRWLVANAERIGALRKEHAGLAAMTAATPQVATHGEPHGGNLVLAGRRLVLVDWDTVAMAPPERDLWLAAGQAPDLWQRYESATGLAVRPEAIHMYSVAWRLADIEAFVGVLRRAHGDDRDTEHAFLALTRMDLA